ncbi:hypothetical protein NVP1032O_37 [Vibrio phage 1.032.O._10N.261.54.F5]|nr:hypothetical protein NVP1032O_37 [Vibrio phage 1.032.O._10N.261.54.F5]
MKNAEGFFAGTKAFNLIAAQIGVSDDHILREIEYNGFSIKLDTMLNESDVIGVGEPYASIAKKMQEHFNA